MRHTLISYALLVTPIRVHKKRARSKCDNYILWNITSECSGKEVALVLLEKMQVRVEPQLWEVQCSLGKGKAQ